MNGNQLAVVLFALVSVITCLWAIVVIIRSPRLRFKPLWLIGSLFGFMGMSIGWNTPDDLFFFFGVVIPVVTMFKVATGQVLIQAAFPVVAAIALAEARPRSTGR